MRKLADGYYDTCPKYGPKVYMPDRLIRVVNNVVHFVKDDTVVPDPKPFGWPYRFSVASFFDVNVLFDRTNNRVI